MRVTPWLLALALGLVGNGGCAAVARGAAVCRADPARSGQDGAAPSAGDIDPAGDADDADDPCADPDMLDGLDDPCYVDVPPEEVRRTLGENAVERGGGARSPR